MKLGDLFMPLVSIMISIVVIMFMVIWVGGIIPNPLAEEQRWEGYLDDFDNVAGYGVSETVLIVDNHTRTFFPKYSGDIPINHNVAVIYKGSLNFRTNIILDIRIIKEEQKNDKL